MPEAYYSLGLSRFLRREFIEASRLIDPLNQTIDGLSVTVSTIIVDIQRVEEKYERGKAIFGDQWLLGNQTLAMTRLGTRGDFSLDDIEDVSPIFNAVGKYLESPKEGLAVLRRIFNDDENLLGSYLIHMSHLAAYFDDLEFAMEITEKGISVIPHGLYTI